MLGQRRAYFWVAVALCLIAAGFSALAAPNPTAPLATPTPAATATLMPTATPTATATPRPPTPTATLVPTATATVSVASSTARQEDLAVDFGDFVSTVRLWYPAGSGPFPTVLILSGSGADHVDQLLYQRLTEELLRQGYAVARYTKHYVFEPRAARSIYDTQAYMYQVQTGQLLIDADQVYRAIAARPRVARGKIVLYGQSEGGKLAAQLALAHPDVGGVILHGAPARRDDEHSYAHYHYLGRPFLTEKVDTNRDGYVTQREMLALGDDWEFLPPQVMLNFLFASSSLNLSLDTNRDGRLSIALEIDAAYEKAYREVDIDDDLAQELPPATNVADYRGPILVQQGGRDGYVSPDNAELFRAALAASGHPNYTIQHYPSLGHALGLADSKFADPVGNITAYPLLDLIEWLKANVR